MIKRIVYLFVLSTVFIYSQNNRLNFTVDEVNQLLNKASTSIQPSDTTALMLRVRQEALVKMNYADTSYLFDRAKIFIKDSLNIVRADLDTVRNEVSQRLDSTQVKSLITDSLTANTRNWQTLQNVADRIKDSLNANTRNWQNKTQVSAIIKDSLDINSRNWQNKTQISAIIGDSLATNARGWQTLQDVSRVIKDSLDVNSRSWQSKAQVSTIIRDSLDANTRGWQSRNSVLATLTDSLNLTRAQLLAEISRLEQLIAGIQPTYPLPVTNLNATVGSDYVTLTWTNPAQVDSVWIERSIGATETYVTLAYVKNSTTYTDTGLIENVTYSYRLRVYFGNQASSPEYITATPRILPNYLTLSFTDVNFDTITTTMVTPPDILLDFEEGNISELTSTVIGGSNTITANSSNPLNGNYDLKVTAVDTSHIYGRYKFTPFADSVVWVKFKVKFPPKFTGAVPYTTVQFFSLEDSVNGSRVIAKLSARVASDTTISTTRLLTSIFPTTSIFSSDGILLENIPQTIIVKVNTTHNNGSILVYIDNNLIFEINETPTSSYNPDIIRIGLLKDDLSIKNVSVYFDDIVISNDSIGLYRSSSGSNWNDGFLYATLNIKNDSSKTIGIENIYGLKAPFYSDTLSSVFLNAGQQKQINIYANPNELNDGNADTLLINTTEQVTQKVTMKYIITTTENGWFVDKNATGLNNGTSWTDAWTSLANINWNVMQDGDTLYISGGTDSLVYNTAGITIERNNVTITKGKSAGHNGRVIFKNTGEVGSNTAIYFNEKKNITIDGLEFVNYRKGISPRSRSSLGVENVFVKNCKMYFTVDSIKTSYGDVEFFGTDHGGTSDTSWTNRFNNIHIVNNEFISPKWCITQIDIVEATNCSNVYVVGNKFINQNNSPDGHDDWFVANATHSYILKNFYYYHNAKARFDQWGNANGIGGGEKAGYNVIAFNIFVGADSVANPAVMGFYRPYSMPTSYRRAWERMIVVNNTFFGSQAKIRLGADSSAYIANNIFYRATTATHTGKPYIMENEAFLPINDSIRYNAFINFNQYTSSTVYVSGVDNSSINPSNYAIASTNSTDWYSPFTSGILKLSEPDSLVNDSSFIPDTTKPYYIDGEDMQTIIPQRVIDSNMKEAGLSWFQYYWNNATDYFGNPYRNKVGAVQQ